LIDLIYPKISFYSEIPNYFGTLFYLFSQ